MKSQTTSGICFHWMPVLLVMLLPFAAGATTTNIYYVGPGSGIAPYDSWATATNDIQTAVNTAAAGLGVGTNCIVLVTNGVYTLASQVEIQNPITLRGFNGRDYTTIDGGGVTRCVMINDAGAVLDGFTLSNGYMNVALAAGYGAGINVTNATVMNCRITRNVSGTGYGAGVYASGATISNCIVSCNSGSLSSGSAGGIYAAGACTISDCLIVSNRIKYYGGVYAGGGLIKNCEISYNYGGSSDGGIYTIRAMVFNCLILANETGGTRGGAGGKYKEDRYQNCTIVGNKSGSSPGGLTWTSSNGTGVNNIVWGNLANNIADNVDVGLTNYMIYSCAPELLDGLNNNTTHDPKFKDWDTGHGYGTNHIRGDYTLDLGSPCIDTGTDASTPNRDLANNPRPIDGNNDSVAAYDMGAYEAPEISGLPLSCSFLISPPGSGLAPLQAVCSATVAGDVTGLGYFWDFGDGHTQGWTTNGAVVTNTFVNAGLFTVVLTVTNSAAETAAATNTYRVYAPYAYVVSNGAPVPPFDTWAKAATNIQDAVDVAGEGFTTVVVSNGSYRLTNQISITKSIMVRSQNGRNVTFVNGGSPLSSNRCIYFNLTVPAAGVLDGFTISNGYAAGSGDPDAYGGGVYARNADVKNCTITLNRGGSSSYGGGLYLENGTVTNCLISLNQMDSGYGIGIASVAGVISNCVIIQNGNDASGNHGGGVYVGGYGSVNNCLISSNIAKYGAGAEMNAGDMWNSEVSYNSGYAQAGADALYASFYNCLCIGNQASSSVGGITLSRGASYMVANCTVVGNRGGIGGGAGGIHSALYSGGYGAIVNSIIYGNQTNNGPSNLSVTNNVSNSCAPELVAGVNSNVTASPQFVAAGSGAGTNFLRGDYHLKGGSPCEDKGALLSWMTAGALDLEGRARVQGPAPNMGAYETIVAPPGVLIMVR